MTAHIHAAPNGEVRLWDSQWVNIVNHDNGYRDWDTEDAVAHAVRMTEAAIRSNFERNSFPPPRTRAPNAEETEYQRGVERAEYQSDCLEDR